MVNFLEKTIDLGFGLFAYTRDKVEELVEELVKKGEVEKKDAQKFAGDLVKRGEEQRKELVKLIGDEVSQTMSKLDIAKKEDIITRDELSKIIREQIVQVLTEQGILKKENEK